MSNNYTIQFRQDVSTRWISNNPVLALGEPGWETDTGLMKMGDGLNPWTSLDYFYGGTGPSGPLGPIGNQGLSGPTGATAIGAAVTGANEFYGDQIIEGGIRVQSGLLLNPDTFTGSATVPDGFNGSLVGPVTLQGTIDVQGSGVLTILG